MSLMTFWNLIRRFPSGTVLTPAVFALLALNARADVAVLREKGPHSGSAFSTPGLIAEAPADLKVAMKTANVKIHLRPGDGNTLKADCTADFELEDSSPAAVAGQLYLVGFPVTGLSSKVVTIDNFTVTVDGKEPATVLRRVIGTHFRSIHTQDTPIAGSLDSRILDKKANGGWDIRYEGSNGYRGSYLWQQSVAPSQTIKVHVAYTVTLSPQSIHYSKTYDSDEDADAIIAFKSLNVDNWDDQHFFFDYVLRTGATWDGPIGNESVTVSIDPSLGVDLRKIIPMRFRESRRFRSAEENAEADETDPFGNDLRGFDCWEQNENQCSVRFRLTDQDPQYDLLLAIPVSAIKRRD